MTRVMNILPREMSGGSADNDLMCSIVNEIFAIYHEEHILEHVQKMGTLLKNELQQILTEKGISGILHGEGLFLGLELPEKQAIHLVQAAKACNIFLGKTGNTVMFRPPLVIQEDEIRYVCDTIRMKIFST